MNRLLAINIGTDTPLGSGALGTKYSSFSVLMSVIIKNSLTIAGIILLCFLILGGVTYIIGAGGDDPKKAQQSQAIITNTLIGFAIVFLAYFIIQIVEILTGLKILNPGF